MKKKIGIDVSSLIGKVTGIGNYLFFLLKPLIELRKEENFFLYAYADSPMLAELATYSNVTIRINNKFSFSEAFWSQTTLALLAYRDNLDLFWGPGQSIPLYSRKKQKNLMTVHDFTYILFPATVTFIKRTYLQWCGNKMACKANLLLANSVGTQKKIKQIYDRHSVVLQPPMKPTLQFHPKETVMTYLEKEGLTYKKYALLLGTLEPRKNILPVLRLYSTIKVPLLPLVIVGKKGWYSKKAHQEISLLQKESTSPILEKGYLSDADLSFFLSGARYLLMPSLYEGYGMGLKEARMLHCPVICTDVEEMLEAAEYDARLLRMEHLQEDLLTYLSLADEGYSPIRNHYPSNEQLVHLLSDMIANL